MRVDTAVILAAGKGGRLAHIRPCKPLAPCLGIPLLEHSIQTLMAAGIRRIVLICGYRADEVSAFAGKLGRRLGVEICIIRHDDWPVGNGSSALAARVAVHGSFLLVMCDHLFDAAMLRRLMRAEPPDGGLVLAVDGHLENPLVDMEDVTRVQRRDKRIAAIGKGLAQFDAFDTGAFLCTPGIFTALADAVARHEGSLSAAVMRLAAEKKALTLDVSGAFWIDVDDAAAMAQATRALTTRGYSSGPTDQSRSRVSSRERACR